MKKLYAVFCLTAAFLLSGCDVFMNSKNDETSTKQPADTTPAFEYTAENDVPASTAPFDKNLCYENADSLVLSDGDWTLNDVYVSEGILNTKIILKGSAANNKIEWKSAVIKFDMSAESESTNESQQTLSEQDEFKEAFDQVKTLIFGDKSEYVTFSNGYLTDDKLVYIAKVQFDKVDDICRLENKISNSAIKTNPNKTKYVIQYDNNGDGIIYLYKNANLNDKETIPENQNETENPKEDENQSEVENPKDSEEDLGYTVPTLPASVGTDPFKGKTFADESHKYVFGSDGTFTYYAYPGNNKPFVPRNKSAYTYDADTKLLTSHWVALLNEKDEFVSFNEYKQSIISMVNQEMANASEADKKAEVNALISMTKKEFEKTSSYKAELVNGKLSLQTDYFTEVPDIKNLYLVNITCEKVNNSSVTLDLYGESNAFIMGLGTIRLEMPFEGGTYVKRFDIDKITDNTIEASGENEIWWVGENHTEEQSLVFSYAIACNNDGTLTFTISGNDAVTKTELGATDSNPNPSYQIHSAGASILEVVTE